MNSKAKHMEIVQNTTESEQSQMNANQTHKEDSFKNTELTEAIPIETTPFTAVRFEDKWFLTMGKYRLTEELGSFQECENDAFRADWERIMSIMQIMIEENNKK